MTTFVAIYRGPTVAEARLIAVSADPALVADVSNRLLHEDSQDADPVIQRLESGRRAALRLINREVADAPDR